MRQLLKKIVGLAVITVLLLGCKTKHTAIKVVQEPEYELQIAPNQKAVLILFPCFPCDKANTRTEAKFLEGIEKQGVTTLLLSYNRKLFLTDAEQTQQAASLNRILDKNRVEKEHIYIGGFSSGGNVSVVLSNYLLETNNAIQPKGLFVVDSPLDLEQLYKNAQTNLKINKSEEAVEEAKFIIELFESGIGKPEENIEKYKQLSPYLMSCESTSNIKNLKSIKTRFYCEPDLDWQTKNRGRKYEDLNAYHLDKAYHSLLKLGAKQAEFIVTTHRGLRANGEKNPHSWSLVEKESLLRWLLE